MQVKWLTTEDDNYSLNCAVMLTNISLSILRGLFVLPISSILHHHKALLHHCAVILDCLLTILMLLSTLALKNLFSQSLSLYSLSVNY